MFAQAAHENCWDMRKCSFERPMLELVTGLAETGFIRQHTNPSSLHSSVFSDVRLHQISLASSRLREGDTRLKAQATQSQSHLLLHTRDLKKVVFVCACTSTRAQGCLSGMGGAQNERLRFTVRTSLSLPPQIKPASHGLR